MSRPKSFAWAIALALVLGTAAAKPPAPPASAPSAPSAHRHVQPPATLVEDGSYVNSSGHVVHSPAHTTNGAPPQGASAKCADGTFSFSEHRRGTCSHHGGVAAWL